MGSKAADGVSLTQQTGSVAALLQEVLWPTEWRNGRQKQAALLAGGLFLPGKLQHGSHVDVLLTTFPGGLSGTVWPALRASTRRCAFKNRRCSSTRMPSASAVKNSASIQRFPSGKECRASCRYVFLSQAGIPLACFLQPSGLNPKSHALQEIAKAEQDEANEQGTAIKQHSTPQPDKDELSCRRALLLCSWRLHVA